MQQTSTYTSITFTATDPDAHIGVIPVDHGDDRGPVICLTIYAEGATGAITLTLNPALALKIGERLAGHAAMVLSAELTEAT